jgi:lambda repressor-like predicted transcriptional regulator
VRAGLHGRNYPKRTCLPWLLEGHGSSKTTLVVLTGHLLRCSADLADLRERSARALHEPIAQGWARPPARQQQRRLAADEAVAVAREYRAGADMRHLARKYGVHRTTISGCLTKLAIPRHEVGLAPDDVPEAAELYRAGWSLARLSAKYGCTDNTVRARLLEVGVVMRPRRGGRRRKVP